MPLPVQLKEIAAEMETSSEELQAYINRKTGELLSIPVNFELSIGTVTLVWGFCCQGPSAGGSSFFIVSFFV